MNNDHSHAEEEWWPYGGDPIEPTDEHAIGALNAMTAGVHHSPQARLGERVGYVWIHMKRQARARLRP